MSRFPSIYAESTINRMYKKLALPEKTVRLLFDYFSAMAALYEVLPLRDAFDIISRQNEGLVTLEEFVAFSEIARHEEHEYYILSVDELYAGEEKGEPIDRTIVHESLLEFGYDEYYAVAQAQQGKPLYVPTKEELLRYKDFLYFEVTPQTRAMREFLCKKLKISMQNAEDITADCITAIKCSQNAPLEEMVDELERMEIRMDTEQFEKFAELFYDLNNHTRLSVNRGFTPLELREQYYAKMPQQAPFTLNNPAAETNGAGINVLGMNTMNGAFPLEQKKPPLSDTENCQKAKKVGRNDPCPCGSGKKYKKCCGK